MADEPKATSWWQTLPGLLTALAAVLSALAGLVVAVRQGGAPAPAPTSLPSAPTAAGPATDRGAEHPSTAQARPAPPVMAQPPDTSAASAALVAPPIRVPTLAGVWRDEHGTATQIEQVGNRSRVAGRGVACTGAFVQGYGEGVLQGYNFETRFQTTTPSTGVCRGSLSADGRTTTARCVDSMCGEYTAIAVRQ